MKKGFAIVLAIAMLATMSSVTAFAAENKDTVINATASIPDPTYTVTIPATVDIGTVVKSETSDIKTAALTVSVENVAHLDGKTITITLASDFKLEKTGSSAALAYEVFNAVTGGTALATGGTFTTFTADGSTTGRVEVDQVNITEAGSYSDTITFTIALV